MHTCTHGHSHTAHACTRVQAQAHTRTLTQMRTQTHNHLHTCTHQFPATSAHTHTQSGHGCCPRDLPACLFGKTRRRRPTVDSPDGKSDCITLRLTSSNPGSLPPDALRRRHRARLFPRHAHLVLEKLQESSPGPTCALLTPVALPRA